MHPARCLSRRLGRRQVSWLADRRPPAFPEADRPQWLVWTRLRRSQLRGQLRIWDRKPAPHSLFTLLRGDRRCSSQIDLGAPACQCGAVLASWFLYARAIPNHGSRLTLFGGARSGKSRYAESLIAALPPPWIYVATAEAGDDEMTTRIDEPSRAPRCALAHCRGAARACTALVACGETPVLVDCLTLWLSKSHARRRRHRGGNARDWKRRWCSERTGCCGGQRSRLRDRAELSARAQRFRDAAGRAQPAHRRARRAR